MSLPGKNVALSYTDAPQKHQLSAKQRGEISALPYYRILALLSHINAKIVARC